MKNMHLMSLEEILSSFKHSARIRRALTSALVNFGRMESGRQSYNHLENLVFEEVGFDPHYEKVTEIIFDKAKTAVWYSLNSDPHRRLDEAVEMVTEAYEHSFRV